jgi:uncharacterized protein YndB with AHSA1/START domain
MRHDGVYREVVEPERLVFAELRAGGAVGTVTLTDLGDGRTEMLFQQRGAMSPEQYERAGEGWSGFFDRIAERLADA